MCTHVDDSVMYRLLMYRVMFILEMLRVQNWLNFHTILYCVYKISDICFIINDFQL